MKALIVGFGKMGMLHAATLKSLESISEIVIAEHSELIREGIRTFNPKIKVYFSYDKALEKEKIDLAVVATPNHTHFEVFKDLISRGISVFVEKPFVATHEEAQQACELARAQKNAKVMVGYCLRFLPTFELAKAWVAEGKLGRLVSAKGSMFSSDVDATHAGWRFEKEKAGGGVLLDLGCHVVDLMRDILGTPQNIQASTQKIYSKHVEDAAKATWEYENFKAEIEVSWSVPGIRKPMAEIQIEGDQASLSVNHYEIILKNKSGEVVKKDISQLQRPVPFDLAGPFYTEQFVEFISAIKNNIPHRNNAEESLLNHQILDGIKHGLHYSRR